MQKKIAITPKKIIHSFITISAKINQNSEKIAQKMKEKKKQKEKRKKKEVFQKKDFQNQYKFMEIFVKK